MARTNSAERHPARIEDIVMRLFTLTSASMLLFLFVASPLCAQPRWTARCAAG